MPFLRDVATAFMLLTRLPVGRWGGSDLARGVWAFPVVGLVVGLFGGFVYWAISRFGVPPLLAASWALVAITLMTGAFHEDGLADTADGFGGGATRERKLEIMRDSRIGSYGAVALSLCLLIRIGALAALGQPGLVLTALVIAAMAGRGGMIVPLLMLPPGRPDGMAAGLGNIPRWSAVAGLGLVVLALLVLLPTHAALTVAIAALAAGLAVTGLARRQIGGHSGDVLGACEVIVECVTLTVLAASLR